MEISAGVAQPRKLFWYYHAWYRPVQLFIDEGFYVGRKLHTL